MGQSLNTLRTYQDRRGGVSLPDPYALVADRNTSETTNTFASFSGPLRAPSTSSAIRAQPKRQRRTNAQLAGSPRYQRKKVVQIELDEDQGSVVTEAKQLYVKSICTRAAWPETKEKGTIMRECLDKANEDAEAAGKATTPSSSAQAICSTVSLCLAYPFFSFTDDFLLAS